MAMFVSIMKIVYFVFKKKTKMTYIEIYSNKIGMFQQEIVSFFISILFRSFEFLKEHGFYKLDIWNCFSLDNP